MTFKEIYQDERMKPTPAQVFIQKIADVTCRESSTVRQWLSGTQTPNSKAKERIAEALNSTVEELFPVQEFNTNKEE